MNEFDDIVFLTRINLFFIFYVVRRDLDLRGILFLGEINTKNCTSDNKNGQHNNRDDYHLSFFGQLGHRLTILF